METSINRLIVNQCLKEAWRSRRKRFRKMIFLLWDRSNSSEFQLSNCFRLHPTSMISKHSTIPVPGSAPRKISLNLPSIFDTGLFIIDDVIIAELSNKFWMKEWDIFTRIKTHSDLSYIFSGGQNPNPADLHPRSSHINYRPTTYDFMWPTAGR